MDSDGDIDSATVSTDANADGATTALGMTVFYIGILCMYKPTWIVIHDINYKDAWFHYKQPISHDKRDFLKLRSLQTGRNSP